MDSTIPTTEADQPMLEADNLAGDPATLFHSAFASPDSDVVLVAKGARVHFRLYSFTLKSTSGFFQTMFRLPKSESDKRPETIYLDEDEETLEHLFRMISGLALLPIDSYEMVDSILDAADKYEMPGPISIIRLLVMTPPLIDCPLRVYDLATRYGWKKEEKLASTRTLTMNLYDPKNRPWLQRLSTNALLKLFELHHSRREGLQTRLFGPQFVSGGAATCVQCHAVIEHSAWRELRYKILIEMDMRPLGDTILESGLIGWSEAQACWRAACNTASCGRVLYDRAETVRVIRLCIEELPSST